MKWYVYVICVVLIVAGCFCGGLLYREVTKESYTNGSIDISNKFSQEAFYYSNSQVTFYGESEDENGVYSYLNDVLKVSDFDGSEKQYQVLLNDYVCFDTDIQAGSIDAVYSMDFYDTSNNLACSGDLEISIKFLSDRTSLKLSVKTYTLASYFEQYFSDNGIHLKVIELKG